MLTLLFAGHDTSATSLTRILWHLHSHPEAEARLRAEQVRVKGVLKRCGRCVARPLTYLLCLACCAEQAKVAAKRACATSKPVHDCTIQPPVCTK